MLKLLCHKEIIFTKDHLLVQSVFEPKTLPAVTCILYRPCPYKHGFLPKNSCLDRFAVFHKAQEFLL